METDNVGRPNIVIGVLAAIACEFIFGLSYMTTKFGMESASSLALLGWRFFVAFIAMSLAILFGIIK
ncbi:MAG: EamA/RhaT family transporter, partial [Peptostreptococcus sp.]|nr:EamA/RhaT family transporter [Peptostreptococcus sp.]